jgi:hypothetical protein
MVSVAVICSKGLSVAGAYQSIELLPHDPVAFARGRFQLLPIKDPDVTAAVSYRSHFLKLPGGFGDAGTARSQHRGDKLMGKPQVAVHCSVLTHQEPFREPRFNAMGTVAGSVLRDLDDKRLCVAEQ